MNEGFSIAAVLLIIGREVWAILKDKNKDLKDNTMATLENSFRLKEITKKLDELSTLPKDMNIAFSKIRSLEDLLKVKDNTTDMES